MHLINQQTQRDINRQARIVDNANKEVNEYIIREIQQERMTSDRKILKDLKKIVDVKLEVETIGLKESNSHQLERYRVVNKYRKTNKKPAKMDKSIMVSANLETKKELNKLPKRALRIIKHGRREVEMKRKEIFDGLSNNTK